MNSLSFAGDEPHGCFERFGARRLVLRAAAVSAMLGRAMLALVIGLLLAAPQRPATAAELQTLEIATKTGVQAFTVELAVTPDEHERGLMFRKELPEGRGMLFDFKAERPVDFWMHNTYIPLDIIFIRGDGRILRIAENAEPLSDKHIPSGGPVRGVLEVIGGTSKKLGIAPGDRVAHPIFGGR